MFVFVEYLHEHGVPKARRVGFVFLYRDDDFVVEKGAFVDKRVNNCGVNKVVPFCCLLVKFEKVIFDDIFES